MRNIIAARQKDFEEKPYDICLDCPYLGESCDGPNFLGMSFRRWVEWCSERKKALGYTNAHIAEAANLAKSTVDNVFAGRGEDTRMSTMQAITKVLVGGCWGQYPCHYASVYMTGAESPEIRINALQKELDAVQTELAETQARLQTAERDAQAAAKAEKEAQKKVDYLKEQIAVKDHAAQESAATLRRRDRTVRTLGIIAGVLVAALLALFVIDAFVPTVGWFRY